ncbi:MAG: anthranilate synthase component I [Ponticaulis sp.]|nr:anthranilate synthase component I [Ponticaulis sp.]|tara:strand:+ start:34592 stop:36046 length:1455 start_codon:yes stop_codon:yes gene_type:complete
MTTSAPEDRLIVRRRIADTETPISALLKLGADTAGHFLFESIQGGHQLGRYSFIGINPELWWRVQDGVAETSRSADFSDILRTSDDPLQDLDRFTSEALATSDEDLPPMASGAFGYLGYDMIRYFEPVGSKPEAVLPLPEAVLVRPQIVLIFDHLYQELLLVGRVSPSLNGEDAEQTTLDALDAVENKLDEATPPTPRGQSERILEFTSNKTREDYHQMVETARTYIRAGDIFQVVPSQRFSTPYPYSSLSYYRALRSLNPSAFMFHMRLGAAQLVGCSPEILVRVRDGRMSVRPIAGTRPRSNDAAENLRREQSLLSDKKELAEHLMLLDLGRNDVGRVCEYGSVEVTEDFVVEHYSHVMHIVSQVEGNLRSDKTLKDALMAGFPAGTVSGAPKIRAMQIIDELEGNSRGVYGGAVGYFGWKGDLDTCIALRTSVIENGRLHIQAGGGVVLDSDPEYEYQETLHKAKALKRAAEMASRYEGNQ